MKKIIIVIFLMFCFARVNSQSYLTPFNDRINFKREKSESAVLFSLKAGYHTEYKRDNLEGFNGGLIFSVNIDGQISEESYISLSGEVWRHSDIYKSEIGFNTFDIYPRTYTGSNFSFNYLRRFGGIGYSINLGIGGGFYFISTETSDAKVTHENLSLKLKSGIDLKISEHVWISPEIEYNHLMRWENMASIFSFKIGPTIRLIN